MKDKVVPFAALLVSIGTLIFVLADKKNTSSIVYVDLIKVFNEFNYKKDRQKEYDGQRNLYKNKLDTLGLGIVSIEKMLQDKPDDYSLIEEYNERRKLYSSVERYFSNKLDSVDQAFNNEVWSRINAYVKSYGDENKYDLIIGGSGAGNIMYGSADLDVTDEVIEYVNKKYEGD